MYETLQEEEGEVEFASGSEFDESWDGSIFCMIQSSEIEADIEGDKIKFNGGKLV